MAIAIRGTTPATAGANTSPSVSLTSTRQPQTNDVLLIIEGNDWDQLADLGTPTVGGSTTGVTAVTNGSADGGQFFAHCKAWTKVITSGGSDLTVAFGTDGGVTDEEKCIVVYVLSGVDTSTPVDIAGGNFNSSGSTSHVAPSVTATVAGFLICHANDGNGASSGTSTAPGSMSEQYDTVVSGSMAYTGATEQLAGTGATGTRTFAKTGNATYGAISVVMKPASGGGSTSANAENAAATGAANDPAVSVAPASDVAAGTGAAQTPTASAAVNADSAAGTGAAQNAAIGATVDAGAAAGSVGAFDAAVAAAVNVENAAGTAAANDATVSTAAQTSANAENASGAGAANDAAVAGAASADVATVTGSALDAGISATVPAGVATATGAALDALTPALPDAAPASGSGSAFDALIVLAVDTEVANVAGVANAPTVSVGGPGDAFAEVAMVSGAAFDARTHRAIPRPGSGTIPRPFSTETERP